MFIRLTFLAALIFFMDISFFKCSSSEKTEINKLKTSNEYFPLKDNSSWKYINEAPREETVIIDVKCKSSKEEGKFELSNYPFFGIADKNVTIFSDKSGNVYVTEPNGKQLLLLPETGKFKDDYTWKYNDYLYGYLKTTPTQVKTEAGTFDCIFILFTEGFTFTIEMWLAKDVGIVKWGANRTNPPTPVFQYYVLKEYN